MISHTKKFYTKIGRSLRVKLGHGYYRIYIVGVVESEMIVYRYYGRHKQWWHYDVEHWKRIKFYHELAKTIE